MGSDKQIDNGGILTPIKLKEKIGYGLGDLGFNFYWANIYAFLLIFYTDVCVNAKRGWGPSPLLPLAP